MASTMASSVASSVSELVEARCAPPPELDESFNGSLFDATVIFKGSRGDKVASFLSHVS